MYFLAHPVLATMLIQTVCFLGSINENIRHTFIRISNGLIFSVTDLKKSNCHIFLQTVTQQPHFLNHFNTFTQQLVVLL